MHYTTVLGLHPFWWRVEGWWVRRKKVQQKKISFYQFCQKKIIEIKKNVENSFCPKKQQTKCFAFNFFCQIFWFANNVLCLKNYQFSLPNFILRKLIFFYGDKKKLENNFCQSCNYFLGPNGWIFCIFPQTYLISMDLRIHNLEGHQNCINGLKVMAIFIVSLSLVKFGIPLDIFAVLLLR